MKFLRARLLTESGSPKKLQIPPQTTKPCPVSTEDGFWIQEMRFEAYTAPDLARRSLFYIQTGPIGHALVIPILIYNGGWENQWIEHEEMLVSVHAFRV